MADTLDPPVEKEMTEADWKQTAEFIADELRRRAISPKRKDKERQWKEVDRQVAMEPISKIDSRSGKAIVGTAWMPELECPLQAQALEILTADARRLLFPDDRNFFSAHVAMEDGYLQKLEQSGLVFGVEGTVPVKADQEGVDALLEGVLMHHHSLYDFRGMLDLVNAEAFKYGTYVARARMASLDKFTTDFRGRSVRKNRVPVLMPQSIKHTYLDDTVTAIMHEGMMVAPSFIYTWWHTVDDLKLAANKGSTDPKNENGGWMPSALVGVEPIAKDKKSIQVAEMEGDIIVPRPTGPGIFLPNVIVTIVVGKGGPRVIRYREREFDYRSYLCGHYHREDIESPYGVSPLMKGVPIQKAATEALCRTMQAAVLNTEPPVSWNPIDMHMQKSGGPVIEPRALWASNTKPEPVKIGDPEALLQIYLIMVKQYEEITGVSAPRAGAQTKSHQTAFAVDSEQARGQVRTVDYVRSQMFGLMPTFLHMEHDMLRQTMKKQPVFIPKFNGWAEVGKEQIPERTTFDVHGAAGPLEEREKAQRQQLAMATVLQIEPVKVQLGGNPMELEKVQRAILQDGGFSNVEEFFAAASAAGAGPDTAGSELPAVARLVGDLAQRAG